ncbi:hypothetical protein [Streptomyces sp. TRM68367]|uniref:hypothetical protein n=1 Tax=Streptomyces sp. TRM68367 TaxID=2758415 RepID=UPI00165B7F8F|nr:hypothetical protein [Streptomyces sp. TRM68367]MBC9728073.1 hypothetical protein [Streptomyces sp. TRM68367]
MAAGLTIREARSAVGTMRKVAARLAVEGTPGRSHSGRAKARDCRRYTPAEVAVIATAYRSRKPAYKVLAANLVRAGLVAAA